MARMNRNMIWPSAWPQREPATTKARPAAFSITSIDIRMKMMLRRTRTPSSPRPNSTPATIKPCDSSTTPTRSAPLRLASSEVIGSDEAGEQQHRRKLDGDRVAAEELDADLQ